MRVLFYVPDNRITHSYMPTLWPYVLKSLTPPGHTVTTLDGNVVRMDPAELAEYVSREKFDLVGIGGMTRTIHRSYAVADSVRAIGVPVVMGGPHVTEEPEEALEHADGVACGEADDLWPQMLKDFEAGHLQPVYRSCEKPSLENYPRIPWEQTDFRQFSVLPGWASRTLRALGWGRFDVSISPVETGRGCPYRCDFCTVSPFFGEKIRFRTNENVIDELKLLKRLGRTLVFFVDDNFAINPRRAKSLMRSMIEADIRIPWVAQISMNLLRDQELLDLMKQSKCICVFIGLESVLPESLKEVSKTFNKPEEYGEIIGQLQRRGICCVTAFIVGIDGDRPGVARKTWEVVQNWPPGFFPVFSQLTPLPGTPLYKSLRDQGRLEERHWLNYRPYGAAFTPKHMAPAQLESEVRTAWGLAYSAEGIYRRVSRMTEMRFVSKLIYVFATLAFRGIYFRQMTARAWLKLIWQNRSSVREVFSLRSFTHHGTAPVSENYSPPVQSASPSEMPGS
ncbi:MAG: B12-binding domain-containing radical SAM protein [Acidobacteria bacterium]|nr:MAG: B12-binding domain-containing radical SAM protein [Acidobacteriota bacterium]